MRHRCSASVKAQFFSTIDMTTMKANGTWKGQGGTQTCMTGNTAGGNYQFTTPAGTLHSTRLGLYLLPREAR